MLSQVSGHWTLEIKIQPHMVIDCSHSQNKQPLTYRTSHWGRPQSHPACMVAFSLPFHASRWLTPLQDMPKRRGNVSQASPLPSFLEYPNSPLLTISSASMTLNIPGCLTHLSILSIRVCAPGMQSVRGPITLVKRTNRWLLVDGLRRRSSIYQSGQMMTAYRRTRRFVRRSLICYPLPQQQS